MKNIRGLNVFPINQPEVMIANAAAKFDAEGRLTDEPTQKYIRDLLQALNLDAANIRQWQLK